MLRQLSQSKQRELLKFIQVQNCATRVKRRRQHASPDVASAKRAKLVPQKLASQEHVPQELSTREIVRPIAPITEVFPFWTEVSKMLHVFGDVMQPQQETIKAAHNAG